MPYFKKVAFDSIESGLMEAVLHKWIGPKIRHSHDPEGSSLTVGQTFLVFTFLLTFIFLSLVIYFIEVIIFKIFNWCKSYDTNCNNPGVSSRNLLERL